MRSALLFGLGTGSLNGRAEVAWAFWLTTIFATRSYYVPAESPILFALAATVTDALLVAAGAALVAAATALLRRAWRPTRALPHCSSLIRWEVLCGSLPLLLLYWKGSYLPPRPGLREAAVVVPLVALGAAAACWGQRWLERRHRGAPALAWLAFALMLAVLGSWGLRSHTARIGVAPPAMPQAGSGASCSPSTP